MMKIQNFEKKKEKNLDKIKNLILINLINLNILKN
jgi:hypothetical protein